MTKTLLALMCLAVSGVAYAAPTDERPGVCYMFKGDKLLNKGVCVVSTGDGAGGMYEALSYNGTDYLIETALCHNKKTDEYTECGTDLNGLPAKFYNRNLFYKRMEGDRVGELTCYLSKKIDICYK